MLNVHKEKKLLESETVDRKTRNLAWKKAVSLFWLNTVRQPDTYDDFLL